MKKILWRTLVVIAMMLLLCGCSTTTKTAEEKVMSNGPSGIEDWKTIMGNYESYFQNCSIRSQQVLDDCFFATLSGVTEDEYKAFINEITTQYPNNMAVYYGTEPDDESRPLNTFYGETEDGLYSLTVGLCYNEYVDKDSLLFSISCNKNTIEETKGE